MKYKVVVYSLMTGRALSDIGVYRWHWLASLVARSYNAGSFGFKGAFVEEINE